VNLEEAQHGFACNSLVAGKTVFIHQGNKNTVAALEKRNFDVVELDTSEFLRSGGSVFCMTLNFYS
jgi:N-dimethylarginine dimethylaminohydrolase